MSETDTPLSGGTESATLIENDTPQDNPNLDPLEDNEEEEIIGGTEDEPAEAEPQPEEEATGEEETAEEPETKEPKEASDDVVVALPDGSKVELVELKKGYLRQADYSRKTAELTNTRKAVAEQAERINRVGLAFYEAITATLPQPPDPALMYQDFQAYQMQKEIYAQGQAKLDQLIQLAQEPKSVQAAMAEEDRGAFLTEQRRLLSEALPVTKDAKGWEGFQKDVMAVGRKVGLSDEEMAKIDDHRFLVLGYYAAKGMQAEEASRVAKQKVVSKPPVAAPQRRSAPASTSQDYVKLIRKASETGSIDDVLAARAARRRG